MYYYLIVGSGLYGAVFAHEAKKRGKKVLVIERRAHIGGNIYTENRSGINVHVYGPHIFHTNNEAIWKYVNQFATFNNFILSPLAVYKNKVYNLPFNMNTFYQMWNIRDPEQARLKIAEQTRDLDLTTPANLEEQAIKLVGNDLYKTLIKGYTEKQWGRSAKLLPPFIIKRLPVRFTFDNNYFNDRYQGIPIGGYTQIIEKMLTGIEVKTDTDYFKDKAHFNSLANKVVYTGCLDEFYNFEHGYLEYRSLEFKHKELDIPNYQGVAMVNYTDKKVPYTRIVEHKHFEFGHSDNTIITEEYSKKWSKGLEPFYPINDPLNTQKHKLYTERADAEENVIFGGRLAEYRYYDMHQIIALALNRVEEEIGKSR
jgi:UDP-galactopyranose mutase